MIKAEKKEHNDTDKGDRSCNALKTVVRLHRLLKMAGACVFFPRVQPISIHCIVGSSYRAVLDPTLK